MEFEFFNGYKQLVNIRNWYWKILLLAMPVAGCNIALDIIKKQNSEDPNMLVATIGINLLQILMYLVTLGFCCSLIHQNVNKKEVIPIVITIKDMFTKNLKYGLVSSLIDISYFIASLIPVGLITAYLFLDDWIEIDDFRARGLYFQVEFLLGFLILGIISIIMFTLYLITNLNLYFYCDEFRVKSAYKVREIFKFFKNYLGKIFLIFVATVGMLLIAMFPIGLFNIIMFGLAETTHNSQLAQQTEAVSLCVTVIIETFLVLAATIQTSDLYKIYKQESL